MAVGTADIEKRYSTTAGSAGDSEAGTASGSLGKYMSTTEIADAVKGNLIPGITEAQNESGITVYRCYFVVNNHASQTWKSVKVWIASQEAGGGQVAIGLDPAGVVDRDDSSAQAAEIADEFTAPSGVDFSGPTTIDEALEVGDVPADDCFAIWVRVTVQANTPAVDLDDVVIRRWGTSEP